MFWIILASSINFYRQYNYFVTGSVSNDNDFPLAWKMHCMPTEDNKPMKAAPCGSCWLPSSLTSLTGEEEEGAGGPLSCLTRAGNSCSSFSRSVALNVHQCVVDLNLVSVRILIQLFISMRIRIQGAKLMRIHADPDLGQSLKKVKFYMKNILEVGNRSKNIPTKAQKPF